MNNFPLYGRMHNNRKNTATARKLVAVWEDMTGRKFPGGPSNGWLRQLNPTWYEAGAGAWKWELGGLNLLPTTSFFGSPDRVRDCLADDDLIDLDASARYMTDERLLEDYERGLPAWRDWKDGKVLGTCSTQSGISGGNN